MLTNTVLGLAVLFQLLASFIALRLVRVTGWRWAWLLVSIAILLMALRRGLPLIGLAAHYTAAGGLGYELLGLAISILMALGLWQIAPLFLAAQRVADALKTAQLHEKELAAIRTTASTIAHSLNSPLTGILADTKMLRETVEPGSVEEEMLDEIREAALHMRHAVHDLERLERVRLRHYPGDKRIIELNNGAEQDEAAPQRTSAAAD
jgi:signal transduction histidine kinase